MVRPLNVGEVDIQPAFSKEEARPRTDAILLTRPICSLVADAEHRIGVGQYEDAIPFLIGARNLINDVIARAEAEAG